MQKRQILASGCMHQLQVPSFSRVDSIHTLPYFLRVCRLQGCRCSHGSQVYADLRLPLFAWFSTYWQSMCLFSTKICSRLGLFAVLGAQYSSSLFYSDFNVERSLRPTYSSQEVGVWKRGSKSKKWNWKSIIFYRDVSSRDKRMLRHWFTCQDSMLIVRRSTE